MINPAEIFAQNFDQKTTSKWLNRLTRLTPLVAIEQAFGQILNRKLQLQLADGELDFLIDRVLCLEVEDLNLSLYFTVDSSPKKIAVQAVRWQTRFKDRLNYDSKLSGHLQAYIWLMANKYDPDTLFFNRKLVILGDTELSLTLKNLLDSLEVENMLPPPICRLVQKLSDREDLNNQQQ